MASTLIARLKKIYATAHERVAQRGIEGYLEEQSSRVHTLLHVCFLVGKSFVRNKCPVRATALSYTTLLALVPLLAIGVSITSSLLKERGEQASQEMIEKLITTVAPQIELFSEVEVDGKTIDGRKQLMEQINGFITNFQTTRVGFAGLLGLILVAILLLNTIEVTFNDIWGVTQGRNWFRRLVQYWTAISLGPVVIVLAFLLTQGPQFQATQEFLAKMPFLSSIIFHITPFVLISLGFALFYKLMPNTQVEWSAALIAGVVGGCFWLLVNLFNKASVGKVITWSKLYGSLAIIPVFLVGVYFSWLIVLFGAQVAYALQNRRIYLQERKADAVSQSGREFVALRVMTQISRRFEYGALPPTILDISDELGVSSRLVARVLHALIDARLVVELTGDDASFTPGQPLEGITCQDVLQALRSGPDSAEELTGAQGPVCELVRKEFEKIGAAEKEVAGGVTMTELVRQLPPLMAAKGGAAPQADERVKKWETA